MTTTTPTNYYTVNNSADPHAVLMTQMRTQDFLFWEQVLPGEATDIELAITTLAIATGYSRQRINQLILAFTQLHDLPRLNALQHELYHLDHQRLIAISNALFGLRPEHLGVVDEHLTNYLIPTAPNQNLPTPRAIAKKIEAIRDMLGDPKAGTGPNKKDFHIGDSPDGTTELYASVDPVEGKLINDAVAKHAAETGLSKGEAFTALLLNNLNIKVVINLYAANDLANAPVWASGIGWLDQASGHHWLDKATHTQNMDAVIGKHLKGYAPSSAMRAAVEGRDGGCSSPYCTVNATHCDLDHRINHDDGGCTCMDNLCALCRRHHNGKTCERMRYLKDSVTGITITVMADGTWAVTVPEGPLTPHSARWAQTVSQYRTAHRKRWAAAAKREAAEAAQQEVNDPPPF